MMRVSTLASISRLGVGVLALCALPVTATEPPFSDVVVELVQLDATPRREGHRQAVSDLLRIEPGMSAQALETLIGRPDSLSRHDGLAHWDYNIGLPIAGESSELVCQFKVLVADDGLVTATHWRRRICSDLHAALVAGAAPVVLEQPAPAVELKPLAADVLFDFASAELTAQGRIALDAVAGSLKAAYADPLIVLVSHADRIGPPQANLALSKRRAEAVRAYLAARGLPQASMLAEGRGDAEPLVICENTDLRELRACLQPNRRVEIKVFERN